LDGDAPGEKNVIAGTVINTSFRGKYTQVWMESAGQKLMFELQNGAIAGGSEIWLKLDPRATNILPA
jgi:hypothetical protein